eukprot:m.936479 g.936479  ORF g.936479 m.936479 type:complete len:123 (+) comp23809_c1_seq19:989-1357(+)
MLLCVLRHFSENTLQRAAVLWHVVRLVLWKYRHDLLSEDLVNASEALLKIFGNTPCPSPVPNWTLTSPPSLSLLSVHAVRKQWRHPGVDKQCREAPSLPEHCVQIMDYGLVALLDALGSSSI